MPANIYMSAYSNPNNTQTAAFGSTQGLLTGCAGCKNGHLQIGTGCDLQTQEDAQVSANRGINRFMKGIRGQVGGGISYTSTPEEMRQAADGGLGYGRVPVQQLKNCNSDVKSSTSLGAAGDPVLKLTGQKGGGPSSCVDHLNNSGPVGYGLNVKGTSGMNATLGYGTYPVVSAYNRPQCPKYGGKRKRRSKKKRYSHPKKGQPSRTRKGRQAFVTHKGDKYYNARRHRQKRKHKPYTHRKSSHPKKGQPSRTRKGRQAFITHRGDKYYDVQSHRQKGVHKPYVRRSGGQHPKKGMPSLTRPGREDFISHLGDKKYNRRRRRQEMGLGSGRFEFPVYATGPYQKKLLGGDNDSYSGAGALGGGRRQRGGNGGDANGTDANNAEAQAVEPQSQAGSSLGTSPVGTYLPAAKSPAAKGGSRKKKHYRHPKKGQASRTRKGRQAFVTHKGDKDYNARRHRQKKKHKPYTRRKRRTKQRGGYAQWMSNIPSTPGFASPNPGPLPWATGPLSHTRQINCNNNYDHFTGKNNPSGVYDKAAPPTPFGGTVGTKK